MRSVILFILTFLTFSFVLRAKEKQVLISEFGIVPGDGKNALVAVREALHKCKEKGIYTLAFPMGRYDFWVDSIEKQNTGFDIDHFKGLKIEGNNSLFIFHGLMSICTIAHSENVSLSGFSIDWERPFISQGKVVAASGNYMDVEIDPVQYPFSVSNGKLFFHGEDWTRDVVWYNLYDGETREIAYGTTDMPMGERLFNDFPIERIADNRIRVQAPLKYIPAIGAFISMWHGRYMKNGIFISESKNISLKDINVYHALSNGVLGHRSENIDLNNVNMTVNTEKGRVFSLISDASHFNTCRGLINVENCCHTGQGDDFINVHGMNILVTKITNEHSIEIPPEGKASSRNTIKEGDEMWFVNKTTMQRGESRIIKAIIPIRKNGKLAAYKITFDSALPKNVRSGDVLENKSWYPDVTIRNCRILKKHRARGVLVSTPGTVLIENNFFRTAGAAILIEGDNNFWYESGACDNVLIQHNVFEDCLTSPWGNGVIAITPSHRPKDETCRAYHKNIRIKDNIFKQFGHTLLYARSVENLSFSGNQVIQTIDYRPFNLSEGFFFDGCRKVNLANNSYRVRSSENFTLTTTRHMKDEEIQITGQKITILPE